MLYGTSVASLEVELVHRIAFTKRLNILVADACTFEYTGNEGLIDGANHRDSCQLQSQSREWPAAAHVSPASLPKPETLLQTVERLARTVTAN